MTHNEKTVSLVAAGLRSIAASFPGAASIAQAWNEYEAHWQSARVNDFFEVLKSELEAIAERIERVEKYVRQSGEIPSVIERTINNVRREHSENKRRIFARLLANEIAAGPDLSYDDKLNFIDILDALTDYDVLVLSKIPLYNPREVGELEQDLYRTSTAFLKLGFGRLLRSLSKLESQGLIYGVQQLGTSEETPSANETRFGMGPVSGVERDPDGVDSRFREKCFELTPYGREFLQMIHTKAD